MLRTFKILASLMTPLLLSASPARASAPGTTSVLEGTWLLLSAEDRVGGEWVKKYGEKPKGYFTFGSDGRASVQFMKTPPEPRPSPDGYLAYFGTYEVDAREGTFAVRVEGSLHPALVGTTQIRHFRIDGDELMIGGDAAGYRRLFRKVKSGGL